MQKASLTKQVTLHITVHWRDVAHVSLSGTERVGLVLHSESVERLPSVQVRPALCDESASWHQTGTC